MSTDHEATAKALLPCEFIDTDFPCGPTSLETCCSCERRPAVAAALAERDAEIAQLRAQLNIPFALLDSAEKEVSEVDELLSQSQRVSSRHFDDIIQLRAKLETAQEQIKVAAESSNNLARYAESPAGADYHLPMSSPEWMVRDVIAQLRAQLTEEKQYYEADYKMLKAECEELRAKLTEAIQDRAYLETSRDAWVEQHRIMCRERDAAYKRGLRDALEECYDLETGFKCRMAIAGKIDKAK